jgi:hypothetical protein
MVMRDRTRFCHTTAPLCIRDERLRAQSLKMRIISQERVETIQVPVVRTESLIKAPPPCAALMG